MKVQNFLRKLGGVIEILGHIANANEPSKEDKEAHNRLVEEVYDSSYYSGYIGEYERESWKEIHRK